MAKDQPRVGDDSGENTRLQAPNAQDNEPQFEDTDRSNDIAPDGMPFVYCNVDLELKDNPTMFDDFESGKVKIDLNKDEYSKGGQERRYRYKQWITWKQFKAAPLHSVLVEKNSENDRVLRATASVNGVEWSVWKNDYFNVPLPIWKIFRDSQKQTASVGRDELVQNVGNKFDAVTHTPKDPSRLDR